MCRYSGDILTPHFGNAFVWHFILFGLFLVTTLCDRQYYSHCTDEALEALKVYFCDFFFLLNLYNKMMGPEFAELLTPGPKFFAPHLASYYLTLCFSKAWKQILEEHHLG